MPKIYDNIEHNLSTGLQEVLPHTQKIDLCVGYFNIRGWKHIASEIDTLIGGCRLLIGMQKMPLDLIREQYAYQNTPIDNSSAVARKKELAEEFRKQLTIGVPTEEDERALRLLLHQLKNEKVVVKLHLRYPLHAKLYLCYLKERNKIEAFLGSSNLTFSGLQGQGELNIDVEEQDAARKLEKWFEDRWADKFSLDISKELIEVIENSWAREVPISPYHIYLKMIYHLSSEARAGISQFNLPKIFEKELLDFQQKAVLVAAKYLHQRNGVLIGDVVGLGKTITATAVAKLFEEDFFFETLVICPKNLVEMWEGYFHKYQLRGRIISASVVGRDLPTLRRYRVVIIDESHNLRNPHTQAYLAIKEYLTKNESKVILLSATPYNKTYLDLSSQLRLFLPDDQDLGTVPQQYVAHLGGEPYFVAKHTDTFIRSIKAFEKSEYAEDWQELMRMFLVRRTRSFVKNHYAKTDTTNTRKYLEFTDGSRSYFPERIPKKMEYSFDVA
ncbi:MAG: NgoFVII family restriction endonuclease, partial [Bacteroidetes bacterium]